MFEVGENILTCNGVTVTGLKIHYTAVILKVIEPIRVQINHGFGIRIFSNDNLIFEYSLVCIRYHNEPAK